MTTHNKPDTLKIIVEIEFTPDHDEIVWYCDEDGEDLDIRVIANHLDASLRPYDLQPSTLRVIAARYDNE